MTDYNTFLVAVTTKNCTTINYTNKYTKIFPSSFRL